MGVKTKYVLLFIILVILCYIPISFYTFKNRQSDKFAEKVAEYDMEKMHPHFQNTEAYHMGVNSVGKPIFEDNERAFEQAMQDFEDACTYLEDELALGTVETQWQAYSNIRAWMPECDESLQKEVALLFYFLSIYKNSFDSSY